CQNTTSGTVTDANGEFHLTLKEGGYDLIVSYSGYTTEVKRISSTDELNSALIFMKEKEQVMEEISIVVSNEVKNGMEKYGSFFLDEFLGRSENSKSCTIDNPDVLKFFFYKKRNKLKITGTQDLLITNKALGYRIRYQLDSFTHDYSSTVTQYTGYPFFEELEGTEEEQTQWEINRRNAYEGSIQHFMRSYFAENLGKDGFKLETMNSSGKVSLIKNPYDSTIMERDEEVVELHPENKLRVVFTNEKPESNYLKYHKLPLTTPFQISQLELSESIIIEKNGYFYDQRDFLTIGYWSWEKLGDLLPYDYDPDGENTEEAEEDEEEKEN
ncbi:MAG: carboxypeptidase-like regulatory domain-containing protein, partial [Chitinophagaceae bacterium]